MVDVLEQGGWLGAGFDGDDGRGDSGGWPGEEPATAGFAETPAYPDLHDDDLAAPIDDEPARLAALHDLRVLDSVPESAFDRLTRWAAEHFGVQTALVSLVDADRQWFKSAHNLAVRETPRDVAFCNVTILSSRPTVVEDASRDPRFRSNPLVVGDPQIRFYAGAPIVTADGYAVGTFCIIDPAPRSFPITDQFTLRQLAALAMEELAARRGRTPPSAQG